MHPPDIMSGENGNVCISCNDAFTCKSGARLVILFLCFFFADAATRTFFWLFLRKRVDSPMHCYYFFSKEQKGCLIRFISGHIFPLLMLDCRSDDKGNVLKAENDRYQHSFFFPLFSAGPKLALKMNWTRLTHTGSRNWPYLDRLLSPPSRQFQPATFPNNSSSVVPSPKTLPA